MARPKGYDFQKQYEQTIWNLIPSVKPGVRYNATFHEAKKQHPRMSKSTFRDYFRKLPTIKHEDGSYTRDPKVEEMLIPKGIPSEWQGMIREYQRSRRKQEAFDAWKDITEDWRQIQTSVNMALIRYFVTLDILMDDIPKAAAHDLFEQRMKLSINPLLGRAAAIAWKNRRKIRDGWRKSLREDGYKLGLCLPLGSPGIDGHSG